VSESEHGPAESAKKAPLERLSGWFDDRLGLSYPMLRPAPAYSINPFYWLGALAVIAFVIQGITGMLMMVYYVPSPTQAYATTQYIFQDVSYGTFLETVHLYTAYAMIMLAFMHMMRGYFVSVQKKPRELMWVVGMLMGFVTLGFGFTGYLLPWTVVSKSATDVGTGMLNALPTQVSSFLSFLVVGSGGDSGELLRFYDLHIVILPAALLALLAVKMYMLESHGVAEPVASSVTAAKRKLIPIFPDVSFYLLELAALFGAAMLLISVIFPLSLPVEYSAQAAGAYTAQPDWYFLWVYQILKIQAFETWGLPVALGAITLVFLALIVLPFIDRGETRLIAKRMKYITLGLIFVAEVAVLTVWGRLTPGQVISNEQAVLVLGGTALLVALGSVVAYRLVFGGISRATRASPPTGGAAIGAPSVQSALHSASLWTASSFVGLLVLGTFGISGSIGAVAGMMAANATSPALLDSLGASLALISVTVAGTAYLVYRLDLSTGSIKRRVRAFEVGWKE
jgi:quinol-cytochrome oxidoreductase complex cytochrome b subunit